MLDKRRIEEVLMRSFGLPSTTATANILAAQMGLPEGCLQFGATTIDIADPDSDQVLHVQYTERGGIDFVDK